MKFSGVGSCLYCLVDIFLELTVPDGYWAFHLKGGSLRSTGIAAPYLVYGKKNHLQSHEIYNVFYFNGIPKKGSCRKPGDSDFAHPRPV